MICHDLRVKCARLHYIYIVRSYDYLKKKDSELQKTITSLRRSHLHDLVCFKIPTALVESAK